MIRVGRTRNPLRALSSLSEIWPRSAHHHLGQRHLSGRKHRPDKSPHSIKCLSFRNSFVNEGSIHKRRLHIRPTPSATCPSERRLPIRLRLDFSLHAGAVHDGLQTSSRRTAPNRSTGRTGSGWPVAPIFLRGMLALRRGRPRSVFPAGRRLFKKGRTGRFAGHGGFDNGHLAARSGRRAAAAFNPGLALHGRAVSAALSREWHHVRGEPGGRRHGPFCGKELVFIAGGRANGPLGLSQPRLRPRRCLQLNDAPLKPLPWRSQPCYLGPMGFAARAVQALQAVHEPGSRPAADQGIAAASSALM